MSGRKSRIVMSVKVTPRRMGIVRVCELSEIDYYAMLAKVGVHHYNGNNVDLGISCGIC